LTHQEEYQKNEEARIPKHSDEKMNAATMTPKYQTRSQRSHSEVTPLESRHSRDGAEERQMKFRNNKLNGAIIKSTLSPTVNPSTHDGTKAQLSRQISMFENAT
jgi:hypothetical protein